MTDYKLTSDQVAAVTHWVKLLKDREQAVRDCESCVAQQRAWLAEARAGLSGALRAVGKQPPVNLKSAETIMDEGGTVVAIRLADSGEK